MKLPQSMIACCDSLSSLNVIEHFSYVDDKGDLNSNVILNKDNIRLSFNCNYGCGIFELIKK